jgi:CcmD family protein
METVPDTFPALFYGYTAIWGLIVVYLIILGARVRNLEKNSK